MNFNCAPAFGFGRAKKGEPTKEDKLTNPGPDRYQPIKNTIHQPSWVIGSEKRGKKEIEISPGPGSYNLINNKLNGPAYSMATKAGFSEKKDAEKSPSPASYSPVNLHKSSCYTMARKYKTKPIESTPGPANYNIRTEKDLTKPSYIFGTEKRVDTSINKDLTSSPGPGGYHTKDLNSYNYKKPQYSFGKEKRISDMIVTSLVPGPGEYKHQEYIGKEGPTYPFGLKYSSKKKEGGGVGPGQYSIENSDSVYRKAPSPKIGTAKRFVIIGKTIENTPGPGQYNDGEKFKNVKESKPSWKIGTAERDTMNKDLKRAPGPGNYNLSTEIGENAPKYSMRLKTEIKEDRDVSPGPARYDNDKMNLFKKNPGWIMGKSTRDESYKKQIDQNFPGPGRYEPLDHNLHSAPMYGFGSQKRLENKLNSGPGPGSYHIPCSVVDVNNYTREQGNFDKNYKFI